MKEMTREFLKKDDVPFPCKKMHFDEMRVTTLILKDGNGFDISKLEVKDHIKECLIEPLPV
jgi:hypothetical protein